MDDIFYHKYVKYKKKYQQIKNIVGGNKSQNDIILITGSPGSGKSYISHKYEEDGYVVVPLDEIIRNKVIPHFIKDGKLRSPKYEITSIDSWQLFGIYQREPTHPLLIDAIKYFAKIIKKMIEKNRKIVFEGQLRHSDTIRDIFGDNDKFILYVVRPANVRIYIKRLMDRFVKEPDVYGRLGFLLNADKNGEALKDYKKNGIKGKTIKELIKTQGEKRFPTHDEVYEHYVSHGFNPIIIKN